MRLGIIARSDNSGLGNQSRELVNMLNPEKVLLINFQEFNKKKQHPDWYNKYDVIESNGYPDINTCKRFIQGLDVILTCETFYHKDFVALAGRYGVKTVLQYNFEFFESMRNPHGPVANTLLGPSLWGYDEVIRVLGKKAEVFHLPPPTNPDNFSKARENNLSKSHKRLLHIVGTAAVKDRNGTETVLEMLKYSKSEYELVIRCQTEPTFKTTDSRVTIDYRDVEDQQDLYNGFDALVLPRRYAGLCLPMNEALVSGLPIFMTDISPNNTILPDEWLVPSKKISEFQARVIVDVYDGDAVKLAKLIDDYIENANKKDIKEQAYKMGLFNFDPKHLKEKYIKIINK
jgi:hypothetical protein